MSTVCRVCGNAAGNVGYHPREMLFGTRERFDYFQCKACGCLQIEEIPDDLGRYYPTSYFSFRDYRKMASSRLRRWMETFRIGRYLDNAGRSGSWLNRLIKPPTYVEWVKQAGISRNDPVLDIGCGSGKLLVRMGLAGFTDCTGVDPFISQDIVYGPHVRVLKRELEDFATEQPRRFGLVMLHHAYEHMRDPHAVMDTLTRLARPGGCIFIRIPVVDSQAWETYGEDWINLDAPRHLYLHTQASMDLLARAHGLTVEKVIYDSTASQYLGSELYRRDIPGNASKQARKAMLTARQRRKYGRLAEELNRLGRGDMAGFYLRHRG